MRNLTLAAATALVLVASLPALAENGGATDRQSGGISGSQSERRGSYDPYLGTTRRMMDTGSRSTGYSGGVGDRTGHSAQMHDKAQR